MLAHYGYKDGSGDFFLSINTDQCANCQKKPCVSACPEQVLEVFEDDYEDEVVRVKEEHRKKIKYSCAACKPFSGERNLACQQACNLGAIKHSW
ncbi:MAG: ferredoxin [Desulfotomaculaceae bacterium]